MADTREAQVANMTPFVVSRPPPRPLLHATVDRRPVPYSSRHTLKRFAHDDKVAYVPLNEPSGGTVAYIL
jgi:hypothetical protein